MAFDQATRNRLQRFVSNARAILSKEFTRQLQATYGLDPKQGTVAHLDNHQHQIAHLLRETLVHYLATKPSKGERNRSKLALERIINEQAFTVLNRLCALRMAEARGFLLESIGKGYSSKGFQLYHQLAGASQGETGDAYRNYLFSLFDEFSLDLAVLFDRHDTQGRLFPRESALLELLSEINHSEIEHLWVEDETIGWVYQFWNERGEIDKMRTASRTPKTSREMAVRNQFFTPRYVVEFLTDNTLGRIWYEMMRGNTTLASSCRYLVRRPTEIFLKPGEKLPEVESTESKSRSQEELLNQPVYIPPRPLKDPRNIRMLDPACGSMHFGLYAFDLFERIYLEAWQVEAEPELGTFEREVGQQALQMTYENLDEFKAQIPKLIIEHNIYGVDIDPRATQIAGLSLWQRAQRAWHQQGIKPQQRPVIVKSNIVCAEPMPGEKALLKEFTKKLNPPVLGQLLEVIFDKMQLAGEAGTLLKIEDEIKKDIKYARAQWQKQSCSNGVSDMFQSELDRARSQESLGFNLSGIDDEIFWDEAEKLILDALGSYSDQAESNADQKRLFAKDAAKGFAFIDLCRKQFDALLMNPPFGAASENSKKYINDTYFKTKGDVLSNFIERAIEMTSDNGLIGAITSRTCLFLSTRAGLRKEVFGVAAEINLCADLGSGVLDAMVETAAYTISKNQHDSLFYRLVTDDEKELNLANLCSNRQAKNKFFIVNPANFMKLKGSPYSYWIDPNVASKVALPGIEPSASVVRVGLQTGDDFRFLRNFWEIPVDSQEWKFYSKTKEALAWHSPIQMKLHWFGEGKELKGFTDDKGKSRSALRSFQQYFKPGFSYMFRSSRLVPYIVPKGCIPTAGRSQVFPYEGREIDVLAICASNLGSSIARFRGGMFERPSFQASMVQQLPYVELSDDVKNAAQNTMLKAISSAKDYYSSDETTLDFVGCKGIEIKQQPKINFKTLLGEKNDIALAECYGLTNEEYNELQLDLQEAVSLRKDQKVAKEAELKSQAATRYLSWLIGCAFKRWQVGAKPVNTDDIYAELPEQPLAYNWDNAETKIEQTGVADLESSSSLITILHNIADSGLADQCFALINVKGWKSYLEKPSLFFASHYTQYSQNRRYAPIYWQLKISSGSYTLWVYYHCLNEQTLFTCVNDFVEPKLESVTEDLNSLRNKPTRSSQEEENLACLTDVETELKDFRDELLRLAKFWKPNLNDGVQITAAPLWKLFQHKAWQKKLKKTWESLEKGDYDWAHLACSVWPERVLRKCHQDRSLAIAHDVEDVFWHEVKVPVKRGGKLTGKTKLEWQLKDLSENKLTALVKQTITEIN